MNDFVNELLDNISEGIVILKENLEITFWNSYMTKITRIERSEAVGKHIYDVVPGLDRKFFAVSVKSVIDAGQVMFFSAAMHKKLVDCDEFLNLKLTRLQDNGSRSIMMEFINVTNQMEQINQLKKNVGALHRVNSILTEKQKAIKQLAYNDNLTGIANRAFFYKKAETYLKDAKENGSILGVMFIDVDDFKNINDTYGHLFGDRILVRVAKILEKLVGEHGLVSRYGGDEFLIILHNMEDVKECNDIIENIRNSANTTIDFEDKTVNISLSTGVSFYPYDGETIDELMGKADESMYRNKRVSL